MCLLKLTQLRVLDELFSCSDLNACLLACATLDACLGDISSEWEIDYNGETYS